MNAIDAQIGKRLRSLREERKLSLVALASSLNLKPVDLADYETARVRVPAALIFLVCSELSLKYSDVFSEIEP